MGDSALFLAEMAVALDLKWRYIRRRIKMRLNRTYIFTTLNGLIASLLSI